MSISKNEMVANKIRQKVRRIAERRIAERRTVLFEFDSVEWRIVIQQEYLLWPKNDRRDSDRRSIGRRQMLRRVKNGGQAKKHVKSRGLSALLTNEEREMINELIRFDNQD